MITSSSSSSSLQEGTERKLSSRSFRRRREVSDSLAKGNPMESNNRDASYDGSSFRLARISRIVRRRRRRPLWGRLLMSLVLVALLFLLLLWMWSFPSQKRMKQNTNDDDYFYDDDDVGLPDLRWDATKITVIDGHVVLPEEAPSPSSFNFRPVGSTAFRRAASALRNEFYALYGGRNASLAMLERGTTRFVVPVPVQSSPLLPRRRHRRFWTNPRRSVLRLAFGGYSVTTGRGNYHRQSYPYVLEGLLQPVVEALGTGMTLEVINAAVGAATSFPYGWCLRNFWGGRNDRGNHNNEVSSWAVAGWDFRLHEAGDIVEGLEAFVRQILKESTTSSNANANANDGPPLLVVLDTHTAVRRRAMVGRYVSSTILGQQGAVVVHTDPAALPPLKRLSSQHLPEGYRDWRTFGAPVGHARHHPALAEHRLIAYLLAMRLLEAMEEEVAVWWSDEDGFYGDDEEEEVENHAGQQVPFTLPPTSGPSLDDPLMTSLLYDGSHELKCGTTYEPSDPSGKLEALVVLGAVVREEYQDEDVWSLPDPEAYQQGWVRTWTPEEAAAHRIAEALHLGFVDSKPSFYGVYESGPLVLALPLRPQRRLGAGLVLCESHDVHGNHDHDHDHAGCRLSMDTAVTVDGVEVRREGFRVVEFAGASYRGRYLCVRIEVPPAARTKSALSSASTVEVRLRVSNPAIDMTGSRKPCSLSHVIWEEETNEGETKD